MSNINAMYILVGFDADELDIDDLKNFVFEANTEMAGEIIPKWKDLMMYGAAMEQEQDDVSECAAVQCFRNFNQMCFRLIKLPATETPHPLIYPNLE